MVGGDYLPRDVRALAPDGRLVMIAHQQGAEAELNFAQVMAKRLTITGSTLRPQSVEAKARIAAGPRARGLAAARGRADRAGDRPDLSARRRRRAHARMESSAHIGKIVLDVA